MKVFLIRNRDEIISSIVGIISFIYLYKNYFNTNNEVIISVIIGMAFIFLIFFRIKYKSYKVLANESLNNCNHLLKADHDSIEKSIKSSTDLLAQVFKMTITAEIGLFGFLFNQYKDSVNEEYHLLLIKVINEPLFIYLGSLLLINLIGFLILCIISVSIDEKLKNKLRQIINSRNI